MKNPIKGRMVYSATFDDIHDRVQLHQAMVEQVRRNGEVLLNRILPTWRGGPEGMRFRRVLPVGMVEAWPDDAVRRLKREMELELSSMTSRLRAMRQRYAIVRQMLKEPPEPNPDVILDEEESATVVGLITNPPPPSEGLKRALRRKR